MAKSKWALIKVTRWGKEKVVLVPNDPEMWTGSLAEKEKSKFLCEVKIDRNGVVTTPTGVKYQYTRGLELQLITDYTDQSVKDLLK